MKLELMTPLKFQYDENYNPCYLGRSVRRGMSKGWRECIGWSERVRGGRGTDRLRLIHAHERARIQVTMCQYNEKLKFHPLARVILLPKKADPFSEKSSHTVFKSGYRVSFSRLPKSKSKCLYSLS